MHRFIEDRRRQIAKYAFASDKQKSNIGMRAARRGDTLEMLLYGVVGFDYDGRMIDQELANTDAKELKIRINSEGGDAWEGVAIYNMLRSLRMPKSIMIDGQAASAASVIAMAGKPIVMARSSMMMIHECWTGAIGNARDFRRYADSMDALSEEMAGIFSRRTGQKFDTVWNWMEKEEEMYGLVAVKRGFADAIMEDDEGEKTKSIVDQAREWFAEPE